MAFFPSGLWSASQELYRTGTVNRYQAFQDKNCNVNKMIILPQFTFLE